MKDRADPAASRSWFEQGLGLRQKLHPLYHLFRFVPGDEGRRAYAQWLHKLRLAQMERTLASFDDVLGGLGPDSIVLDLGANVGDYTAKLAATGAQVHAFEPEPLLFRHLEDRFAETPNVVLHQAAVAAEAGSIKLNVETGDGSDPLKLMSHSIIEGSDLTRGGRKIEVECVDFFAFIDGLGKAPELVKMDIEGAEVAILERMFAENRSHEVGMLFVETHERQIPDLRKRIIAIHKQVRDANAKNVNLLWP